VQLSEGSIMPPTCTDTILQQRASVDPGSAALEMPFPGGQALFRSPGPPGLPARLLA